MADTAEKRMSLAEFLVWDDGTDQRYELIRGVVRAMAPPLTGHGTIVINIGASLRSQLRPPCRAISEAGVVLLDRADTYYQADLAVTCVPPSKGERYVPEPLLIVEVLSPSTVNHDRVLKLAEYRGLPSVMEILLVFPEDRRIEHWRRGDGQWIVEDLIGEAVIRLASVEVEIPLAAVYENVAL